VKRALLVLVIAAGLGACRRDSDQNKLVDGVPINVTATVVPAQASQQYLFLKRDLLIFTIPVINKLINADSTFPELIDAGGGNYQVHDTDIHYGDATFTIAFQDINGATIDPIAVRSSSNSLAAVTVNITGSSPLFTYTETGKVTLGLPGVLDATSIRYYTGTAAFTGVGQANGYTLNFNVSQQATAVFQGLTTGQVTVTGSGGTPTAPANVVFYFAQNRNIDGTLSWEGQSGTFHVDVTGPGYVITPAKRIILD
jgi:hypothetical protein